MANTWLFLLFVLASGKLCNGIKNFQNTIVYFENRVFNSYMFFFLSFFSLLIKMKSILFWARNHSFRPPQIISQIGWFKQHGYCSHFLNNPTFIVTTIGKKSFYINFKIHLFSFDFFSFLSRTLCSSLWKIFRIGLLLCKTKERMEGKKKMKKKKKEKEIIISCRLI